jgi:hypothetical protein
MVTLLERHMLMPEPKLSSSWILPSVTFCRFLVPGFSLAIGILSQVIWRLFRNFVPQVGLKFKICIMLALAPQCR